MARRWQVITVELLGGRDIRCDPPPGRVLVCPPSTTFADLGAAIDQAFARWDLAHLRLFELADGTRVVDERLAADLTASSLTPVIRASLLLTEKVSRHAASGAVFTYVFDLGDEWTHRCEVTGTADPESALGIVPDRPLPSWGWGSIPDQYGRRWADDDGSSDQPPRRGDEDGRAPAEPAPSAAPWIDLRHLRQARAEGSVPSLVAAVSGVVLDPALQQVGAALLTAHRLHPSSRDRERLEPVMVSVLQRLQARDWVGDDLLAEDLLAAVQRRELAGRAVPVDLDELATSASWHDAEAPGCYLDRETGEVWPATLAVEALTGDDVLDVEAGDYLHLELDGVQWSDLAAFVETVEDPLARDRLAVAIEGKGAFQRFRHAVHDLDLGDWWRTFSGDRLWGRVREELAAHGIHPV